MEVDTIQIMRLRSGRWSWEVSFDNRDLDQEGYVDTFCEALRCVRGALENAELAAA